MRWEYEYILTELPPTLFRAMQIFYISIIYGSIIISAYNGSVSYLRPSLWLVGLLLCLSWNLKRAETYTSLLLSEHFLSIMGSIVITSRTQCVSGKTHRASPCGPSAATSPSARRAPSRTLSTPGINCWCVTKFGGQNPWLRLWSEKFQNCLTVQKTKKLNWNIFLRLKWWNDHHKKLKNVNIF